MESPNNPQWSLQFDPTPDATGMGRIIVDGKFYGLPAGVVQAFQDMTEAAIELNKQVQEWKKENLKSMH